MALLFLPLLLTGRALFTGGVYAPIDLAYGSEPLASVARASGVTSMADPALSDVPSQFLPWNAALRWGIAHRQWPLWNPFEFCGSVLAGAAQSAPYHPVTLLSLILPAPDGVTFIAAMTFFLAALSAFLFLRTLCASELAALFGAAGWCLSQQVVTFTLTAHGAAIAVFPLLLFGIHEVARAPGVRALVPLTLAMALMTLCGHPETLLHSALIAIAYAIVVAGRDIARVLGSVALAGLITLLLTAIFLVPLLVAIPQTREYHDREMLKARRTGNSWGVVLHLLQADALPFADGTPSVEGVQHPPRLRHEWAGTAYAGAMLFAPALFGLWRVRSRMTWFFGGVLLVALLVGAESPGINDLLLHLPLLDIAVNTRMIAFGAFALCALAAAGFDAFISARGSLDVVYLAVAIAVVLIAVDVAGNGLAPSFVRLATAREVIPLLLAFALLRTSPSMRVAAASLIALLLLQRVTEIGGAVPTLDRRAFFPPIPGLELLRGDPSPSRVVGLDLMFMPNTSAMYGLEDVRGYEAMTFGRLADTFPLWSVPQPVWSNRVDDLSRPFLSLMNVRYALAPPTAVVPSTWRVRASFPNYRILENMRALPRAFVPAVVHLGSGRDTLGQMTACRDFGSEAWIETPDLPLTQPNGSGRVTTRAIGGRLLLHASMDAPGWVVISETAWKGWRVRSGGQPLKVQFADHAFVGVYVPQGEHDLVMEYWPHAFVSGAAATIAALLGLMALALRPLALPAPARPPVTAVTARSPARP